jgi:NAD+-dependent secondary alcohol dehydrogenase Adh1
MKAALLRQIPATHLDVTDVPDAAIRQPDELLVRVEACGICGTDPHLMEGGSFHPDLPFILGHEPAGTVVDVGSPALAPWLGTRVTATIFVGCGHCPLCRTDAERLCPRMQAVTGLVGAHGAYAEYLVIRAAQAVALPAALSSAAAAGLADAGPTAVNAVAAGCVRGPATSVVVGGGAVGFLCAELLRRAGHQLIVVETNDLRRSALARLGHTVAGALDAVDGTPDLVIDCAAAPEVVPWALDRLAPRGVFVAVGFQTVPQLALIPVVRKEIALFGVRSGSRADLLRILDLAATGRIRLPEVTTWPLAAINEALAALRGGALAGKAVIEVAGPP